MEYVFTEKMDCFSHFVRKIGCKSLAELFSKLLEFQYPNKEEIKNDYLEQRQQMMELMVDYYVECEDFEIQDSVTQIICDLFEKVSMIENGPALIDHFFAGSFQKVAKKLHDKVLIKYALID